VLLGVEWQPRALIRAQLIEDGFDVLATDSWPMMRHLVRSRKPPLAIVDLQGLAEPRAVLDDLAVLMTPARVLVLAAAGTVTRVEIERLGFRVLQRPIAIGDVVKAAADATADITRSP
jgi:hypothetical protein